MRLSVLFREFYNSEKAGGLILVICTVFSLLLANSSFQSVYTGFWHQKIAGLTIEHWINDGLMALFFLLIGLEIEREIYSGELSNLKNAILPGVGAIGGMLVPAGLYLVFNHDAATRSGAGIPMATDIAFALGILSLLGKKVHASLKVFLASLAIVDDLGAILIIAFVYSKTVVWMNLLLSLAVFAVLLLFNRLKIRNLLPYIAGGVAMWYFMLKSGIHPTVTGILLAFAVPFGKGDEKSSSYILQHLLHKPVAFFILPVFALANTAIILSNDWFNTLGQSYSLGIIAGLFLGKPVGITLFCFIAVTAGLCALPSGIRWKDIIGTGFLAGIGFTMSIFITILAFDNPVVINNAKSVILLASLIAGITGLVILSLVLKKNRATETET